MSARLSNSTASINASGGHATTAIVKALSLSAAATFAQGDNATPKWKTRQGGATCRRVRSSSTLRPGPRTPRQQVSLAALDSTQMRGIDRHQVQPSVLQRVVHRMPIVRGRLEGSHFHRALGQPVTKASDSLGGDVEPLSLQQPPACPPRIRGAHATANRLPTSNRTLTAPERSTATASAVVSSAVVYGSLAGDRAALVSCEL